MRIPQAIIRHLAYPLIHWQAGESAELRYLREFTKTEFLSPEQLAAMQLKRLKRRLDYAYRHCPYYREKWTSLGLHPHDFRQNENLADYPVLTKADIQKHRDQLISEAWPSDQMFVDQTGGSTGSPISYYQSYDVDLSRKAATKRHNAWAGYRVGDKAALVWGAPRDASNLSWKNRLRHNLLEPRIWLDTAEFTVDKMIRFNDQLHCYRPRVIVAYARALKYLAQFYKDENIRPYQPHSIITSAEVLDDEARQVIEEVFRCKVFDRYGCREVGVLASECEQHAGLHVMAEGLYLEIVSDGRPAEPGQIGKILVTDFLNDAMPLVRYEIGDVAALDPAPCACGRGLPRLTHLAGRVTDFVVGSDGRLVSGVFLATYVVAKRSSLGQVQIVQDTPGHLVYKIAPPEGEETSPGDLEFLRAATREHLGPQSTVDFEFVQTLPTEPSGKILFCRSTATKAAPSDTLAT